jgi:hypothetical protein
VTPFLHRVADWLEAHVGENGSSLVSDEQLAELAGALGCEVPTELALVLRFERSLGVLE